MNDLDLIDQLRDSMRAHTDDTVVPQDFVDHARRTARRRSARRAAATGTPLLAVAGVATALAAGGGSSSHRAQAPTITVGNARVSDAAYVVGRVRARLADVPNEVAETVETGGNGNPGSDVTATTWEYRDPSSGIDYTSSVMASPSGADIYEQFIVGTPTGGAASWESTNLDPAQHLYAVTNSVGPQGPTLADDIRQIRQELDSGQATTDGTATVDGQQTIKLAMPPQMGGWTSTLYVNAQTYAPVESSAEAPVDAHNGSAGSDTTTETWLPATAGNIAKARLAQIPTGYTEVSQSALERANPAGR
jgi:hypothetical protein